VGGWLSPPEGGVGLPLQSGCPRSGRCLSTREHRRREAVASTDEPRVPPRDPAAASSWGAIRLENVPLAGLCTHERKPA